MSDSIMGPIKTQPFTLSKASSFSQPHSTRSLPNKKSIETKNSATKGTAAVKSDMTSSLEAWEEKQRPC